MHFDTTVRPRSGICNRLNGIQALWHYCDVMRNEGIDVTFSINWPITSLVPGHYSDLFLNPMQLRDTETDHILGWSLWTPLDEMHVNNYKQIQKYPSNVIHKSYEQIPQEMIDRFLPYFDRVQFHPNIIQKCQKIKLQPNTIGVHCRESKDWTKAGRSLRGIGLYCNEIDKLDKELPIYLVTHERQYAEQFQKRYPNRITIQFDKDYTSQTANQLQNSAVDLLMLSKCETLVGDHASSFLANAWWFSGCKSKVIRVKRYV
jgi:hypothetical protein